MDNYKHRCAHEKLHARIFACVLELPKKLPHAKLGIKINRDFSTYLSFSIIARVRVPTSWSLMYYPTYDMVQMINK